MAYTLWSRGRLLGETELAYRRAWPTLMAGDFFPNELGDRLMTIITGVGPALFALSDVSEEVARTNPEAVRSDDWPDGVRQTSEYADAMSLSDELESLDLELRNAHGAVVETERLWIQDTHRLLAMAELEDDDPLDDENMSDELREAIEHDIAIMEEHFASLEL